MSDAVEQVCVLVEHQFVTLVEDRQEPPACPRRPSGPAPLKRNAFSPVGVPTLGRAGLLWDLNLVFPVLQTSQAHHHEEVKGPIWLRWLLNLQ